jgi:hypothetical protein
MKVYLLTRVWHPKPEATSYHIREVTPGQPYTLADNETLVSHEWEEPTEHDEQWLAGMARAFLGLLQLEVPEPCSAPPQSQFCCAPDFDGVPLGSTQETHHG